MIIGDCMRQVKYKDSYIYIDDSKVDDEKTGIVIKNEELDKTKEIRKIDSQELLQNTSLDILGDDTIEKS